MLRSVVEMKGFTIQAIDGEMGQVDELYFDENNWAVRYLVVDVGNWLMRQRVLIVPAVIEKIDVDLEQVSVSLTKEKVEGSPSVLTEEPISREKERELHEYYLWQPYWTTYPASPMTLGAYPPELAAAIRSRLIGTLADKEDRDEETEDAAEDRGSTLRSTAEVIGYHVQASDGDVGRVTDFIFDSEEWAVRHLVVDTGSWLSSREVLIAPPWIKAIHWPERRVDIALTQESIEQSPEYETSLLDLPDYEKELLGHYSSWFSQLLAKETKKPSYLGRDIEGIPVITVDDGRRVGETQGVYLASDGRSLAAIYLEKEGLLKRKASIVKGQNVVTIGPDALLVNRSDAIHSEEDIDGIEDWMRGEDLRGRSVETLDNAKVGRIGDVLMDGNGRLLGFTLDQVHVSGPIADNRAITANAVRKVTNEAEIMTIDLEKAEKQSLRAQW